MIKGAHHPSFRWEGRNFIYIRIPKNATTTVVNALGLKFSPKRANLEDKFIFTFCRNPFARLVSCWADRTNKGGARGEKGFPPKLLRLPFKEFAKRVCNTPDKNSDHHFRSQYVFIEGLNIDYTGRVENLGEDLTNICKIINVKKPLTLPHKRRSSIKSYAQYYDEETVKIVHKRYEKDFKLFGYGDSPDFLA